MLGELKNSMLSRWVQHIYVTKKIQSTKQHFQKRQVTDEGDLEVKWIKSSPVDYALARTGICRWVFTPIELYNQDRFLALQEDKKVLRMWEDTIEQRNMLRFSTMYQEI